MAVRNGNSKELKYSTNGKGRHNFEMLTQKPFAEFKDEVNEGMRNSWASLITRWEWKGQVCTISSMGADAEYKMEGDKVSVVLNIRSFPATWVERQIVYEVKQKTEQACAYDRTAEIEAESRESLRQSALETCREAYLNEFEAGILISRWQVTDEFTKILVALTSSGSAVTGWLLWDQDQGQIAWRVLAGIASVLSITHVALKVSDRVKDWSDTKGHFVRLRTELETFLYHIKVNPNFPLVEFTDRFDSYRVRFGEGVDRKKVDPLNLGIRGRAEKEARERYKHWSENSVKSQPAKTSPT